VPVGELAVRVVEQHHVTGRPVQHTHPGEGLREVLAVGTDVLDRSGTDLAWDAGEGFDPGVALLHRERHCVVPVVPGRELQRVLGEWSRRHAAGRDLQDGPVEAGVRGDEVAAGAQDQQRLPAGIRGTHHVDDLVVGLGDQQATCRAADAQGREPREGDVGLLAHG
jgi:hypothetical protein